MRCIAFFTICGWLPLVVAGCGSKPSNLTTIPVSGLVTYKDAPVEGAVVSFLPKTTGAAAAVGFVASGTTNAEGKYKLYTYESAAKPLTGAVPGEYTVTITKTEAEAAPMQQMAMKTPEQMNQMSPEEQARMAGGPQQAGGRFVKPSGPKNLLPLKYASITDSPFNVTVTVDQKEPIDFKLAD